MIYNIFSSEDIFLLLDSQLKFINIIFLMYIKMSNNKTSMQLKRCLYTSKLGAGDAISALILFVAVLSVSIGVVVAFQQFVVETQTNLNDQQEFTQNALQTHMIVSNVVYDDLANEVTIYVKNVGTTTLATSYLSFFINAEYGQNLNISEASNIGVDVKVIQPQETLHTIFPISLSSGTHTLTVVSEFGTSVKEDFNVN